MYMLGNFCCIRPLNSAVGVVLVLNVLYLVLFLIRFKGVCFVTSYRKLSFVIIVDAAEFMILFIYGVIDD